MPRIQINLEGTNGRTGASWTVTTQWAIATLPTSAAMITQLAAARAALVASTPFRAGVATNYSLVTLKALGYTVPNGTAVWTVESGGAAVTGTGNSLIVPLSTVVSERTEAAGASYRGRSYWPGCGDAIVQSNGSLTTAQQAVVRTSWLAMHNVLGTALAPLGGSPVHVVFSRKTGNMTPITSIRTGDRIDTARGRFGDANEVYVSQAVPASVALSFAPEGDEVDVAALGPVPLSLTVGELADYLADIANGDSAKAQEFGPLNQLLYDAGIRLVAPVEPPDDES